jgi:hypothetical protein
MTLQDVFDDLVTRGIQARQDGDGAKWAQGDLAVEFCAKFEIDPKPGRPAVGKEGYTLAYYAEQIDEQYKRISEFRLCSAFYPPNIRRFGDYATWGHHNRARRASDGKLDNALEALDTAAALHLGADQFRQYLAGEYFAGMVEFAELPARLQLIVPPGKPVWVTVKAYKAGE